MKKQVAILCLSLSICITMFSIIQLLQPSPSQPQVNKKSNYFIAANFYNSEKSLLYSLPELKKTLSSLYNSNNIYLSFVENGSKDQTVEIIKSFLTSLPYPSTFLHCNISSLGSWRTSKILGETYLKKIYKLLPLIRYQKMASLRNSALLPLTSNLFNNSFPTKVIFLNDIYYTAFDLLTLINTNEGDYDISCALDYYYQFYDVLVTRDIEGYWFSGYYPHTIHKESQVALKRGEPFKVKSCWNGVVVMNAEGFLSKGLSFRGRKFDGKDECECIQSECLLICIDFYRAGLNKIFVNPKVVVSYEWKYFMLHTLTGVRDIVRSYQSLWFELEEPQKTNEELIGCSMPPYWEPEVPRAYMKLYQGDCRLNATEYEVYNKITAWKYWEDTFYQGYHKFYLSTC